MKKRNVLITGAGRGIGAATALLFAEKGYGVCVNYRTRKDSAREIADRIDAGGGKAVLVQADVSREDEIVQLFQEFDEKLGELNVLVNNAGILMKQDRVENLKEERIQKIFQTNVTGPFLCCREAIRRMSSKYSGSGGSIVNVSSGAVRTGAPNQYVEYAASKAALDTLTKGLSIEVAEEGIRVNSVRAGFIDTEIHADGGEPDRMSRVRHLVPVKRVGKPEEIAEAIYWLASDSASYTTGACLDVTGGR